MDERLSRRLSQQASGGPALPREEVKVSEEEKVEVVESILSGESVPKEVEEKKEEKEISPPDKELPDKEDIQAAAEILRMVRSVPEAQFGTDRFSDPLTEISEGLRIRTEAEVKPIDVSDILFHGAASQEVTICEGVTVLLRSLRGHHFTLLDRWMGREYDTVPYALRGRLRHFTAVALTVHEINGAIPANKPLPDEDGVGFIEVRPEDYYEVFRARLSWLQRMNPTIIDLLCMHVTWFEQRLRRVLANHLYLGQEVKKS